jgi:hypothetical protein
MTHRCDDLFDAAMEGHAACVRKLITDGVNPNAVNDDGKTALHLACIVGGPDILDMSILIDAGANMDATDSYDRTPMHIAALFGRTPSIMGLVNAGANVDAIDRSGRTPLQLAKDYKHNECAKALAVRILTDRALTDIEWDAIPEGSEIGNLLPVVMTRDGRYSAAKLVSKLSTEKRRVLQSAMMCLSRFVSHDLVEQIAIRCV